MQISAIEGYRLWAPAYDSAPNPLLALEARVMRRLLSSNRSTRVVDIACGTGRWTRYFADRQATVFGIDLCQEMLYLARRRQLPRSHFILADALRVPLRTASAGLVLCSLALGHFEDLDQAFTEMARIAQPGAVVAISDLHPEALAAGWTGSFRVGKLEYSIANFRHSASSIFAAARNAGLHLNTKTEAHFAAPELGAFAAAGKQGHFNRFRTTPALWAGLWQKI